jgi:hypothetical protein
VPSHSILLQGATHSVSAQCPVCPKADWLRFGGEPGGQQVTSSAARTPALQLGHGFLFDEPTIQRGGRPCYSPYLRIYGRYYAGSEPLTNVEFRALRVDELALPK